MVFSTAEVKQIADTLNYEFCDREWLTRYLQEGIDQYGTDWETEVRNLLGELTIVTTALADTKGEIKKINIDRSLEVEYEEFRGTRAQTEAKRTRIVGQLCRLIGLYVNDSSSRARR